MMHSEKSQLPVESKSSSEPLKIDSPDSIHEKEAASFAENITRNGQITGSQNTMSGQIKGNPNPNNGIIAPAGVKEQINSAKGSGDKLPDSVKRMMKGNSSELDDVQIHTDSKAAEVAKVLNAKAFTYGKDIFFGQGMFDTNTTEGKELIAHEVMHACHNNELSQPILQRSAAIVRDDETHKVNVNAHLIFYGFEATENIASACSSEIQTMWNAPKAKISILGKEYDVKFNISKEVVSIDKAMALAATNTDYKNNHIRVEKDNTDNRSKMGGNAGHFVTKDDLGKSTTAAHEFGHSLGLDHPDLKDWRGKGQPSLMVPRSAEYHVDPDYRYSNWKETKYEGINPYTRKVIKSDLEEVKMNAIAAGGKHVGVVTNILFDAQGTVSSSSEELHKNPYGSVTLNDLNRTETEKENGKK